MLGTGPLVARDFACRAVAVAHAVDCKCFVVGFLVYRGFFDVDFVIDDAQKAFAVETNARRTGGTHIYDLLRHLYGADWQEKIYAASNDSWKMNQSFKNGAELLERFKSRLYNGEEGLIITNFSIELGVFGFVLIAKTAESLQTQLDKMGQ